ncbi:MAG: imidazole glycerol phosphate synthase subunit HisH [Gammaproteobacteria bacterium]
MSGIVIVDLGAGGNLRSVSKAVEHVGARARISDSPAEVAAAGHLILPGQGALGSWMARLNENDALRAAVSARLARGPVLGICLGLQALYRHSEENGGTDGLGLLRGTVRHFDTAPAHVNEHNGENAAANGENAENSDYAAAAPIKIPHMGWNRVRQTRAHALWHGIEDGQRFYFVHSYFAQGDAAEVAGECEYGRAFTAAAARGNLFATQFHPEKSQQAGLQLLRNFVNWDGA